MAVKIATRQKNTSATLLERIRQQALKHRQDQSPGGGQASLRPSKQANGHREEQIDWDVRKTDILRPPPGFYYEMVLDFFFNARHSVVMDGQQGPEHAHSYRVQIRCRSRALHPQDHVLVGYHELRERVKRIIKAYNMMLLNDLPVFQKLQPTTENLAGVLYRQLSVALNEMPVELVSVTVWESPTEAIVFRRDDGSIGQN